MNSPRAAAPRLAPALFALLALAACDPAQVDGPPGDTRPLIDAAFDAAPVDVLGGVDAGDGYVYCDARADDPGCPAGTFCETTAFVCVDCVGRTVRCGDGGAREICEAPAATGIGMLTGGFFEPAPCGVDEVCVQSSAVTASCEPVVCEAGFSECVGAEVRRCNASGTEETLERCSAGRACYEGACEFIRHNVLLVFDTSGSMHDYIVPSIPTTAPCGPDDPPCPSTQRCSDPDGGYCLRAGSPIQCAETGGPCLDPFPACDSRQDPLTLFGLSKVVFSESVATAIGGFAQFALQRFPQREAATNAQNCWLGWYLPNAGITGDDHARETVAGGWFDANRHEAFVVDFPPRANVDNRAALLSWLDGSETLSASDTSCATSADCGGGFCGLVNGERRCFFHKEHELRAGGETPLGKSLFYAGEYFRRFVRVDGKPCGRDADCGSAGYLCRDDVCVDPYRDCRDDFIILFTDGEETQYQTESNFFNPVVQARRLAFGLDCETDADCRGGAICRVDGMCSTPGTDLGFQAIDSQGYGALVSGSGLPISVRTTVITLQAGSGPLISANARIAAAGGGVHLDVSAEDPETFKQLLVEAMSPNFKCTPDDLAGDDP